MRLNQKSRLDIRMLVPIHLIHEIKDKLSTFKGIEIAILQLGNGLCEAQICLNDESRRLDSTIVNSIKTRVLETSRVSENRAVNGNSVLAEISAMGIQLLEVASVLQKFILCGNHLATQKMSVLNLHRLVMKTLITNKFGD